MAPPSNRPRACRTTSLGRPTSWGFTFPAAPRPAPRYSTAATAATPPIAARPAGPPAIAPTMSAGAMPWLGLGPLMCSGRLSKSWRAGSTLVRPGIISSPIVSRWASAAPHAVQRSAFAAAGAAHHGHCGASGESPVPGVPGPAPPGGNADVFGSGSAMSRAYPPESPLRGRNVGVEPEPVVRVHAPLHRLQSRERGAAERLLETARGLVVRGVVQVARAAQRVRLQGRHGLTSPRDDLLVVRGDRPDAER